MLRLVSIKAENPSIMSSPSHGVSSQDSSKTELSWREKIDNMLNPDLIETKSDHDRPDYSARQQEVDQYYSNRSGSTWRQRLDMMWSFDEYGVPGPELYFVKQATELSLFGGLCYGSYQESAKVMRIFLEQNKYTMFQHPREAQRALQERVVLAMIQGGWRAGWRMGVLAFTFTSVTQSLVVIRNYINPLDYAVGGAAMGAVYKFHMGPKGMVGAGVAGSFLGLQAGVIIWGLQKFSGETVAEKWAREYELLKETREVKTEAIEQKDKRKEIVVETPVQDSMVKMQNHARQPNIEESDWFRKVTIKITSFLEYVGILATYSSNDSFRISDGREERSKVNVSENSDTSETRVEASLADLKLPSDQSSH